MKVGDWVRFRNPFRVERGTVTYIGVKTIEVTTPDGRVYSVMGTNILKDVKGCPVCASTEAQWIRPDPEGDWECLCCGTLYFIGGEEV